MSTLGEMRAGDVIAGKYVVERVLGEGGMGIVMVATHTQLEQKVAIKFLKSEAVQSGEAVSRFIREARAAARIQSEHVVRVFDVATLETGAPYLVMEYLEGNDLDATIRETGPVPVEDAVTYVLEACEALAQAHKAGIVHRDLKPANLFLARRPDESLSVKILDFGISKLSTKASGAAEVSMTRTSAVMGSPLYMAPEQMRSTRTVDHRADIWSLGIILYESLVGATPFVADTLPEVCAMIISDPVPPIRRSGVTAPLEQIIQRCLEKQPEQRYPDVAFLAAALAPFAPADSRRMVERIIKIVHGAAGLPSQSQVVAAVPLSQRDVSPQSLAGTLPQMDSSPSLSLSGSSVREEPSAAATSSPVLRATSSTFGSTDPSAVRHAPAVPKQLLAIAGITGLIVLVGGAAVIRSMTKDKPVDTTVAASKPSGEASAASAPSAPISPPSATASATTEPPVASASAAAVTPSARPKPPTASTTPIAAATPTTKPSAKPASTKPSTASTSGFGGRE